MAYFIVGGVASFLAVVALTVILFYLLRKNWNYANTTRVSFIAPILVVIVMIYIAITEFVPRALDVVSVASHQFEMTEIDYHPSDVDRNRLTIDGRTYYFSQGTFEKSGQGRYQITYTPRMGYIVSASRLGDRIAP